MTRPSHAHTDVSWNAKGGTLRLRAASGVRALIKAHKPDVLALAECRGIALAATRARTVIKHRTIRPWRYAWQDSALVIARRCKVTAHGVEIVKVPWVGPEDTYWPGKAIVWADVDGIRRIAVHQVWDPVQTNRVAAEAVLDEYVRLANDFDGPVELIGDWNRSDRHAFAKRIGGRVIEGHEVDNAVVRGLDGTGRPGPALNSDHSSVLYRLSAA